MKTKKNAAPEAFVATAMGEPIRIYFPADDKEAPKRLEQLKQLPNNSCRNSTLLLEMV